MSSRSSTNIWDSVFDKNEIMEIAEIIAPFFKSKRKDEFGNSARYITVKDIEFQKKDRADEIEYSVKIELLSDQGDWWQPIIIKQFKTEERFQHELDYYSSLELKLLKFNNIQPLPMIHISQEKKRIIYEDNDFPSIDELELPFHYKDFIMGKLAAVLQGDESFSIEETEMRSILSFLMENFPFNETEKQKIKDLLEPHYIILPNCKGGYSPATLYHRSIFKFLSLVDSSGLNQKDIEQNQAFKVYIHLIQPEEIIVDRMADIAARFGKDSFRTFQNTGNVDEIKERIKTFMKGYDSVSIQIGIPTLEELYPNGVTLDIQMVMSFLLLELSYIHRLQNPNHFREDKDKIRYIYYLLLRKPYLLF